ncbi:MAG: response regulator transcription factor [Bacteroidetes bacterium]|nr:response regulator transcription factor [Bacteroidota bacterium]
MKTENLKIRIALVDDNPVNRNSFIQKMSPFDDIDLCLISPSGDSFLESIRGMPMSKLPIVVFMDIEMPGLNGIETIRIAKSLHENLHFIVLTVFEDEENIFEAIQAGASGYLLKHESHVTIHQSIFEILEFGGAPMSPAIARKTLRLLGQSKSHESKAATELIDSILSEREREILMHMVNGYDAKRIAELTSISTLTVRKHVSNIYGKLHVNSKAQVISLAHKNNWL